MWQDREIRFDVDTRWAFFNISLQTLQHSVCRNGITRENMQFVQLIFRMLRLIPGEFTLDRIENVEDTKVGQRRINTLSFPPGLSPFSNHISSKTSTISTGQQRRSRYLPYHESPSDLACTGNATNQSEHRIEYCGWNSIEEGFIGRIKLNISVLQYGLSILLKNWHIVSNSCGIKAPTAYFKNSVISRKSRARRNQCTWLRKRHRRDSNSSSLPWELRKLWWETWGLRRSGKENTREMKLARNTLRQEEPS